MSASSIYSALLLPKKLGFPLWIPEPDDNLPDTCRDRGLSIGDVGTITPDGAFDVLFNMFLPSDHLVNSYGLPESFVPGELHPGDVVKGPYQGTVIASSKVVNEDAVSGESVKADRLLPAELGPGFPFRCSAHNGAVLSLPEGASREDLVDTTELRKQLLQNGTAWNDFATRECGRMCEGSIHVVTGCDKTSSWKLASFENSTGSADITTLEGATGTFQWAQYSSPMIRHSRPRPGTPANQCVFFRGFTLSVRLPDGDGDGMENEDVVVETLGDMSPPYHPAVVINKHLLELRPKALVSITHDEDWFALIEETDEVIPEDEELLRRLHDRYEVVSESDGVFLTAKSSLTAADANSVVQKATTSESTDSRRENTPPTANLPRSVSTTLH